MSLHQFYYIIAFSFPTTSSVNSKSEILGQWIFHVAGSPGCEHGHNIPKETRHTQYWKKGCFIMESEGFWGLLFFPQDKTVRFPLSKCHSSNARFKSHSPDKKQSKYEIWNPHFYVTTDCRHRGMMSHRVTPCIQLFEFGRKMMDLIAVRTRFGNPSLLALSGGLFGINSGVIFTPLTAYSGGSRWKSDSWKLIIVMTLLSGSGCMRPWKMLKSRSSEVPFAAIWATFSS